jgi:hypothetical protein
MAHHCLAFCSMGTMSGNGSGGTSPSGDDTNVVRVPFGVRRARRTRPQRPDHWATLVLPLQVGGGSHPTPPHAA